MIMSKLLGGSIIKKRIIDQDNILFPDIFNDDYTINITKWYKYIDKTDSLKIDEVIKNLIYYYDPYINRSSASGDVLVDKNNVVINSNNANAKNIYKINDQYYIAYENISYEKDINNPIIIALFNIWLRETMTDNPKFNLTDNVLSKLLLLNYNYKKYINYMQLYGENNSDMNSLINIFYGYGGNLTYKLNAAKIFAESDNIDILVKICRKTNDTCKIFLHNKINYDDIIKVIDSNEVLGESNTINVFLEKIAYELEPIKEDLISVYSILRNKEVVNEMIGNTTQFVIINLLSNMLDENKIMARRYDHNLKFIKSVLSHISVYSFWALQEKINEYPNIMSVYKDIIDQRKIMMIQSKKNITNNVEKLLAYYSKEISRLSKTNHTDITISSINTAIIFSGVSMFPYIKNDIDHIHKTEKLNNTFEKINNMIVKKNKLDFMAISSAIDMCESFVLKLKKILTVYIGQIKKCDDAITEAKNKINDVNFNIMFEVYDQTIKLDANATEWVVRYITDNSSLDLTDKSVIFLLNSNTALKKELNYYHKNKRTIDGYKEKISNINERIKLDRNKEYIEILKMTIKLIYYVNMINLDIQLTEKIEYDVQTRELFIINIFNGEHILLSYLNRLVNDGLFLISRKTFLNKLLSVDNYVIDVNGNTRKPLNLFDKSFYPKDSLITFNNNYEEYSHILNDYKNVQEFIKSMTVYIPLDYKNSSGYPDCVETTLRNFINTLIYTAGNLNISKLVDMNVDQEIIMFYEKYSLSDQGNPDAHIEWNKIIHNIFIQSWNNPNNKIRDRIIINQKGDFKSDFINFSLLLLLIFSKDFFTQIIEYDQPSVKMLKKYITDVLYSYHVRFLVNNDDNSIIDSQLYLNDTIELYNINSYLFDIRNGHSKEENQQDINENVINKLIRKKFNVRWISCLDNKSIREISYTNIYMDLAHFMIFPSSNFYYIMENPISRDNFLKISSDTKSNDRTIALMVLVLITLSTNRAEKHSLYPQIKNYVGRLPNVMFGVWSKNPEFFKQVLELFIKNNSDNLDIMYRIMVANYSITRKFYPPCEYLYENKKLYRQIIRSSLSEELIGDIKYRSYLFHSDDEEYQSILDILINDTKEEKKFMSLLSQCFDKNPKESIINMYMIYVYNLYKFRYYQIADLDDRSSSIIFNIMCKNLLLKIWNDLIDPFSKKNMKREQNIIKDIDDLIKKNLTVKFVQNNSDNIEIVMILYSYYCLVNKKPADQFVILFDNIYEDEINFDILFYLRVYGSILYNYFEDAFTSESAFEANEILRRYARNSINKINLFFGADTIDVMIIDLWNVYIKGNRIICHQRYNWVNSIVESYYLPILDNMHNDLESHLYNDREISIFNKIPRINYLNNYDGKIQTLNTVIIYYLLYLRLDRQTIFAIIDNFAKRGRLFIFSVDELKEALNESKSAHDNDTFPIIIKNITKLCNDGYYRDGFYKDNFYIKKFRTVDFYDDKCDDNIAVSNIKSFYKKKYYKYKMKYYLIKNML